MVKVKLLGLFRLDTGIKELEVEDVKSVKELYPLLLEEAKKVNPTTTITSKDIDGCIVLVNGVQSKKTTKINDGDEVYLMSPVCGG